MGFSSNTTFSNSNSFFFAASDDPKVRSLPWLFRTGIPGFQYGWPAC